ncbi:MAG: alpha/beta hydrolase, partial [Alishewanella sp.]|nr:alpha/beta hydrolase [Alishewanella sp.]
MWPAIWHFAAEHDRVLGHPKDVQAFIAECAQREAKFSLLGKTQGYSQNYDHISMLTHPAAATEHFQELTLWLKSL